MADYNYMQTPKIKTPQQQKQSASTQTGAPRPTAPNMQQSRQAQNQTAFTAGFGGGPSQAPSQGGGGQWSSSGGGGYTTQGNGGGPSQQPQRDPLSRVARPQQGQTAYTPGFGGGASQQPQMQQRGQAGADQAFSQYRPTTQGNGGGYATQGSPAQSSGRQAQSGSTAYTPGFGGGPSQQPMQQQGQAGADQAFSQYRPTTSGGGQWGGNGGGGQMYGGQGAPTMQGGSYPTPQMQGASPQTQAMLNQYGGQTQGGGNYPVPGASWDGGAPMPGQSSTSRVAGQAPQAAPRNWSVPPAGQGQNGASQWGLPQWDPQGTASSRGAGGMDGMVSAAAIPEGNYPGAGGGGGSTGGSQWGLPQWNPSTGGSPSFPSGQQATQGGGSQNFWDSANPWNVNMDNPNSVNKINTLYPIAQFDQNNYQYKTDFNEAQRRWDIETGMTGRRDDFQQALSTREQQTAEETARLSQGNWGREFDHTRTMDYAGLDLTQQGISNDFTTRIDANNASRDVANTYAGANMYGSNAQLKGVMYGADSAAMADMYGADAGVKSAGLYAGANMYGADRGVDVANIGMQGQLGSANIYGNAQMYGADASRDATLGSAGMYSGAQMYGADRGMQGQLGAAQYGLQGTLGSAGLYSGAQRYQTDAQERMNQLQMQNNLQVANTQAYGRSQAPQASWARNWG